MTGLQKGPCHTAGMGWACLTRRENCFQHSNRSTGHVGEGLELDFIHIALACKCAPNYMYAKYTNHYITVLYNTQGGPYLSMSIIET